MGNLLWDKAFYLYGLDSYQDGRPNQKGHTDYLKPQLYLDDVIQYSIQLVSPNHVLSKLLFVL